MNRGDIMALICCPECGKNISDNSDKCIYCGFPMKMEKKHKNPLGIVIVLIMVIICIIASIIFIILPQIYNKALSEYQHGNYTKAIKMLEKIKFYGSTDETIEELQWEYRVYQCVQSGKEYLKNPDSYKIYDIKFYLSKSTIEDTLIFCNTSDSDASNFPAVVIKSTATNGFGGTVTSYDLFFYDSKDKSYVFVGTCDSLNTSSYSGNYLTENEQAELYFCKAINKYMNENGAIDNINIDIDRVNKVIKLGHLE